jgi:DNA replication protein DnaC
MRLRDAATGNFVRDISLENAGSILVSENCACLRRRLARNQLKVIPPAFGIPRLLRLKARTDLHPRQQAAIDAVRSRPNDSYLLLGKNGSGKTHIGWAMFRNALAQRRPAVACTVRDLLAEFRRVEVGVPDGETMKSPRVTAEQLRKPGKPWFLLFDEFEKARPTEFASEQLFNVLDAVKSFNHQIVVTSNLTANDLRAHWSRIDEIWGNSIMTRLSECHQVEMF